MPTRSTCSTAAASSNRARTTNWSRAAARTPRCGVCRPAKPEKGTENILVSNPRTRAAAGSHPDAAPGEYRDLFLELLGRVNALLPEMLADTLELETLDPVVEDRAPRERPRFRLRPQRQVGRVRRHERILPQTEVVPSTRPRERLGIRNHSRAYRIEFDIGEAAVQIAVIGDDRSEERRVGKEGRRWGTAEQGTE